MGILKRARGIICKVCGDFIISRYRHDFKTCKCGLISIDGGQEDYIRIIGDHKGYLWAVEKPKPCSHMFIMELDPGFGSYLYGECTGCGVRWDVNRIANYYKEKESNASL